MLDTTRKTTTRGTTWRALAVVTAAAVLAVGLSSCSPDEAGSAAVVGDRRISTEQVSTAVAEIKAATGQVASSAQVLFFLVIAPLARSAAQSNGVGVSEAEARTVLAKVNSPDSATIEAVRTGLILNKLRDNPTVIEQLRVQVRAVHPKINPRYGAFDPKDAGILPAKPNWMVQPPEPAAGQPGQPGSTPTEGS